MKAIPNARTLPKPLRVKARRSAQLDRAIVRLRPAPDAPGEFGPAATEYRRQLKRLVSSREYRTAAKAVSALRQEWHAANAAARDIDPACWRQRQQRFAAKVRRVLARVLVNHAAIRKLRASHVKRLRQLDRLDRKSTRLNSSHSQISYAVFC